ncbi:glycosyltransferase [Marivita sp.]|uniref:glycosyltransferase family protein n=1 Tax=Marivita sp. TaxID=2003365 RepID=UPI0025C4565F|nr:glycosyltransferase [Marivita sp.]
MTQTSKPKVHWVSPLPEAETDIAHYTARILPELAAACDLTLWTDARDWDRSLEAHCPVRYLDPDRVLPHDFARAGRGSGPDAVFVHIGNSWVFHSGLLRLVRRIPSIVVLHDLAIQELCFDAMHNRRLSRATYEAEMSRWHGPAGLAAARAVFDGQMRPIELAHSHPGFELTLDRAVSVLAHTPAAFQAVQATGIAPAYHLDLPFRPSDRAAPAARATTGPLRFVQFGYIGPNRRLEQVLEALSPLRHEIDFRFDIMGNVWDPSHVQARLDALGLADRVRIHGFVPEPELDARLAEAHLVFNLRYPTMGEASGSQLRIWNASAAAVVTDLGWYGSLPEGTAFKIPLEQERDAVQDLVRRLDRDRMTGQSIGAAGRTRLETHHTPTLYAQGIAEVAARFSKDATASLRARRARDLLVQGAGPQDLCRRALAGRI